MRREMIGGSMTGSGGNSQTLRDWIAAEAIGEMIMFTAETQRSQRHYINKARFGNVLNALPGQSLLCASLRLCGESWVYSRAAVRDLD